MNNKIIAGVVAVVIVAGTSFYGGMAYKGKSTPSRGQFANGQFIGNQNGTRNIGARGGGSGFTVGEILSKDAGSITIKMQDGGTKIALIASSTQIMKASAGEVGDLSIGTNVTVNGTVNSDGSVTAQNVQIRPAGFISTSNTRINQ